LTRVGNGWIYRKQNGQRYEFDEQGRLNRYEDSTGKGFDLAYQGDGIVVKGPSSQLTFTENENHQPLTVTTASARITYGYDGDGRLVRRVISRAGVDTVKQYVYERPDSPNLLTGLIDERGMRYTSWTFDQKGRALSSGHPNGVDHVSVQYGDDNTVRVTNASGKDTTYEFEYVAGNYRVSAIRGEPSPNCPSSNSTFTYDQRGLLKTRRDNKGNLTTYDYDARGLEVSRTEAAGTPQARTVTTQWHPTLYRPLQVDEPGRVTRYRYDAQGRETGRTVTEH